MGARRTDPEALAEMAPLLTEVKDNLDQDHSLEALARAAGASPFQFHRRFSSAVGETPRRHVERVRLERAAYRLAVTDARIIDIALSVGFDSHEAFIRAFRRWSGFTPRGWRQAAKAGQAERMERNRHFTGRGCRFTEVWFEPRLPTFVLAIRRLGPYGELNGPHTHAPFWQEIEAWAKGRGIALGAERWGLFPDDPTLTPPALQGADLCIPIAEPVEGDGRVRCLELVGGLYAKIGHVGAADTVLQGYRQLADAIRRSSHLFREDPPVQVFFPDEPQRSEIWFPVRRPARRKKDQDAGKAQS
jgi:AraC family transcriptional regulator